MVDGARDAQLSRYAELVASCPHNLVSRRDRARVETEHIPEALALGTWIPNGDGERWVDLGTGGGLPGMPLALARPDVRWTLIDATRKKITAVDEFVEDLQVPNVCTVVGRAETLGHRSGLRGGFTGVVSRAMAPLGVLTELARGFLAVDGVLLAVKGPSWEEELHGASRAIDLLGYDFVEVDQVPDVPRPTWVVRMRATTSPPSGYPRRDGIPRQQPL